ncbi:hypothetical protein [Photorhabdus tasmaniensis]|nr:hypothetical protein [Photorhabdus tasmaniensis]
MNKTDDQTGALSRHSLLDKDLRQGVGNLYTGLNGKPHFKVRMMAGISR